MTQDNPDNCETTTHHSSGTNLSLNDNILTLNLQPQQPNKAVDDGSTPQMQNGDLAEADQSRIELQEEEGAVGGVLNVLNDANANSSSTEIVGVLFNNSKVLLKRREIIFRLIQM